MSMSGINAFITGGAQGIGRAFTEVFLAEGAQKVYIADIKEEVGRKTIDELERRYGEGRCALMVVDITDAKRFEETLQAPVSLCGHIDVMVNNAGTFNELDWEPVVQLNFVSLVQGCQLALKHMDKERGGRGGRIINTCSDLGLTGHYGLPVYTATKHAVRAFTTSMAEQPDRGRTGVQMACICPAATDTELVRSISDVKTHYPNTLRELVLTTACENRPSRIAEGFPKLLRMPKLNGAILLIDEQRCQFVKMESVDLGKDWQPL